MRTLHKMFVLSCQHEFLYCLKQYSLVPNCVNDLATHLSCLKVEFLCNLIESFKLLAIYCFGNSASSFLWRNSAFFCLTNRSTAQQSTVKGSPQSVKAVKERTRMSCSGKELLNPVVTLLQTAKTAIKEI